MTASEEQFLIVEYQQAWQVISAVDERRVKILQSFSTLVVAAIGAVGFLISDKGPLPLSRAFEASGILAFTLLIGVAAMTILCAERKANIRYRKKVNLIRHAFLGASTDPVIQAYLTRKDLGIKVPGDAEPEGLGSTLRRIFLFIGVELVGLVIALVYVWARHCGCCGG